MSNDQARAIIEYCYETVKPSTYQNEKKPEVIDNLLKSKFTCMQAVPPKTEAFHCDDQ